MTAALAPEADLLPKTDNSQALRARVCVARDSGFALDVGLHLPGQGVTAVLGPSGCGKTTLLRAVAGLTRPVPGLVALGDAVWQDDARGIWLPTHQRPLGVVFQEASLFAHLSVQGNLDFGLKRVPAAQRRVSLAQAIELLGIGHLLARRPHELSGGERQRVAIARAVATSPRLLLMDEPLAALDAARKAELLPWFERLGRELGIPMLYVTHALDEAARLADYLVLLQAGRLLAQGPCAELMARLDVAHAHGDAASALIEATVQALEPAFHLLHARFAGGVLQCVQPAGDTPRQPGQRLRLRVQARDVSLSLAPIAGSSVLNSLPAVVRAWQPERPGQVLVALDAGGAPLLARISGKSAQALQLAPGLPVVAHIKSVAILD